MASNAEAKTVTIDFGNGLIYDGDIPRDAARLLFPDSSEYVGHLLAGLRHGFGKFTDKSQVDVISTYVGDWISGKRNGSGRVIRGDRDGLQLSNYDGHFNADRQHGYGSVDYAGGSAYRGEWKEGLKSGMGAMCVKDETGAAEEAVGTWIDGRLNGQVVHSWYSSQGSLLARFAGGCIDGKRAGFGSFRYSLGSRYVGHWESNVKCGLGVFIDEQGKITSGRWVNDVLISGSPTGSRRSSTDSTVKAGALTFGLDQHSGSTITRPFCIRLDNSECQADHLALGTTAASAQQAVDRVVMRWHPHLSSLYRQVSVLSQAETLADRDASEHDLFCAKNSGTAGHHSLFSAKDVVRLYEQRRSELSAPVRSSAAASEPHEAALSAADGKARDGSSLPALVPATQLTLGTMVALLKSTGEPGLSLGPSQLPVTAADIGSILLAVREAQSREVIHAACALLRQPEPGLRLAPANDDASEGPESAAALVSKIVAAELSAVQAWRLRAHHPGVPVQYHELLGVLTHLAIAKGETGALPAPEADPVSSARRGSDAPTITGSATGSGASVLGPESAGGSVIGPTTTRRARLTAGAGAGPSLARRSDSLASAGSVPASGTAAHMRLPPEEKPPVGTTGTGGCGSLAAVYVDRYLRAVVPQLCVAVAMWGTNGPSQKVDGSPNNDFDAGPLGTPTLETQMPAPAASVAPVTVAHVLAAHSTSRFAHIARCAGLADTLARATASWPDDALSTLDAALAQHAMGLPTGQSAVRPVPLTALVRRLQERGVVAVPPPQRAAPEAAPPEAEAAQLSPPPPASPAPSGPAGSKGKPSSGGSGGAAVPKTPGPTGTGSAGKKGEVASASGPAAAAAKLKRQESVGVAAPAAGPPTAEAPPILAEPRLDVSEVFAAVARICTGVTAAAAPARHKPAASRIDHGAGDSELVAPQSCSNADPHAEASCASTHPPGCLDVSMTAPEADALSRGIELTPGEAAQLCADIEAQLAKLKAAAAAAAATVDASTADGHGAAVAPIAAAI